MLPTRNSLRRLLQLMLLWHLPALFIAHAQEIDHPAMYIGAGGGYERGLLSGNIPVMSGSNECAGEFTSGQSTATTVWGELSLPELLSSSLGIAFRVSWRRSTTLFAADPGAAYTFVSAESGELVQVVDEYRLHADADAVRLEAQLLFHPAPDWSIGVGPWVGTDYSAAYSITDAVASGDLRFQGGRPRDTACGRLDTYRVRVRRRGIGSPSILGSIGNGAAPCA